MLKTQRLLLIFLSVLCFACSERSLVRSSSNKPDQVTERWLKGVAVSLPPDNPVRGSIERGYWGNGIHEPWMDLMKTEGVREVVIEVKGTWNRLTGFSPRSAPRIVYLKDYSRPGSQIVDEAKLEELRNRGLEQKLESVAIKNSKRAIWLRMDSNPWKQPGYAVVYLCDNEWVPCGHWRTDRPSFSAFEEEKYPLYSSAIFPDLLALSEQLATAHFDQSELNAALLGATHCPSDNTQVMSMLIKAGADVNARQRDGSTLLMHAATGLQVTNVKFLLAAGADPSARNQRGDTALSLVQSRISSETSPESQLPDYALEIVRLLEQAESQNSITPK